LKSNIKISKKLTRVVGRTNAQYNLIEEGDRVLLGLSGGKDSLTLAHILQRQVKVTPFNFEFATATVSYGMGENFDYLSNHCEENNIAHKVIETNTYELSKEKIRKNSSFCSFFSRMRRGALYSYAIENGFNKIALAHHLDDAVESFFMNFLYNGSLRSMPPIYRAQNGLLVIRPLIMTREKQLANFAMTNNIETIGDENCPAMRFDIKMPHARAETKKLLYNMEQDNPKLFRSLKASFSHIHESSFFDKEKLIT